MSEEAISPVSAPPTSAPDALCRPVPAPTHQLSCQLADEPASWFSWLLPAAWAFIVSLMLSLARLVSPFFASQGDLPIHYHLLRALHVALADGEWLPRWAGVLDGGRGDAFFTFYPPLTYWLGALAGKLSGWGLTGSLKATTFLALFLAQLSAYWLARAFFPQRLSLLASSAYVLLPAYPLILLHRGFLANGLAFAFVPLAVLAAYRLLQGRQVWRNALLFALCFSLVLLTHVISTLLCGLIIALLALACLSDCGWRGWLRLALAGVFALALTAFFWLPQQVEMSWVQVALQKTQQDFRNYLLFAAAADDKAYRKSWAEMNFIASCLIVLQSALAAALFAVNWRQSLAQAQRQLLRFCGLLAGFSLLIALPGSAVLWHLIPGLTYIQFPWRLQPLVALAIGLLFALAVQQWPNLTRAKRLFAVSTISWLLILSFGLTFMIAKITPTKLVGISVETELQPITPSLAPTASTLPLPNQTPVSFDDVVNSEDPRLALRHSGNQIFFRPQGAERTLHRAVSTPGGLTLLTTNQAVPAGQISTQTLANARREFTLELPAPTRARLATYYYPHWQARLNGAPLTIQIEPETGLMLFDLPAGRHQLSIAYEPNSLAEKIARVISLLSWLTWFTLLGYVLRRRLLTPASRR